MGRSVWNVNDIGTDEGELISARLDGSSDYEGRIGRAEAVTGGEYQVPWLAALIHSIPRFDLALRRVKSEFQPDQQAYKEVSSNP